MYIRLTALALALAMVGCVTTNQEATVRRQKHFATVAVSIGPQHSYMEGPLLALSLPDNWDDLPRLGLAMTPPVVIKITPAARKLLGDEPIRWAIYDTPSLYGPKPGEAQLNPSWPYGVELVLTGPNEYTVKSIQE